MTQKGREFEALAARLSAEPPEGLRELTGPQLRDLTTAISDARWRQGQALAASGERALGHVPRFLRGPVRRIVG
jgi:hypothetical protein